jgi:hypothetical protein
MSNGAVFDYDFGCKRNWRRWAWNRIAERAKNKDGFVLYLPSVADFDRDVAVSKGFKESNLIAAEVNDRVIESLRKRNRLVVRGTIYEAALSILASGRCVSVINADLTHGVYVDEVARVSDIFWHPMTHGVVMAINMLRGRDKEVNPFRGFFEPMFRALKLKSTDESSRFDPKHRGMQVILSLAAMMTKTWHQTPVGVGGSTNNEIDWARRFITSSSCCFHSYRSNSGQFFDSVVFCNPILANSEDKSVQLERKDMDRAVKQFVPQHIRASCSAVLAHRTRRLSA